MATTNTDSNPFWEFSVSVYAGAGVAPVCLALQEQFGIDVNLLLYALWRGWCGEQLTAAELATVEQVIADWRTEVVLPLRQLRQGLRGKAGVEPTRDLIKHAEIRAEKTQQQRMYEVVSDRGSMSGDPDTAIGNALRQFAQQKNLDGAVLTEFEALARSALQGLER